MQYNIFYCTVYRAKQLKQHFKEEKRRKKHDKKQFVCLSDTVWLILNYLLYDPGPLCHPGPNMVYEICTTAVKSKNYKQCGGAEAAKSL